MMEQHEAQPQRKPAAETGPGAGESSSDRLAAEVQALARLNEASSRLWHLSDPKAGLEQILSAAVALMGAEKGLVQLLGDDGALRLVAQEGFDEAFLDFFREVGADDFGAFEQALRAGERLIIHDLESDDVNAPSRQVAKAAGCRSVLATPILSRDGRRLGMLSTYWRMPRQPSRDGLRLLHLYVQQAADFIDRCSSEQQLRESEQRLKALSDIAPGTILWATSPSGGFSFITRGWQDYTGQSVEQALGTGWLEPVHADNRERARRILDDAAARQEPFVLDYRLRRADGEYRWVLVSGRPRYDERGQFLGFVGSVIDAHERMLAENALRESEAILAGQKEAFQAAMDGRPLAGCLMALVRTAVARYGNARAAFYMLRSDGPAALQHVTGMSNEYARHVDDFKIGPESLACGLAVEKTAPVIATDVDHDPRWEPWLWLAHMHGYRACWLFPVQAIGGPVLGTFALYFPEPRAPTSDDLNVIAALEHAGAIIMSTYREAASRARAEQALKEANRRKDEFLAVLGHELRNPLAPLSMATDLLQQAKADRKLLATVRPMMRRQIDHLTRLVNDLLDVSRISRGHAELQRASLDLRQAVEDAVEQNRPLIAERQHTLIVELGDTPLPVDGDFQRLTQVFGNLLSNAAKYSEPAGRITVRAAQENGMAVVRVADQGFGIPQEHLKKIFEMFSQVPEHRSLVAGGGLGIGLALCRQLLGLHGGFVEVRSEGLGRGSEFIVRLPLAAARLPAETPPATLPTAAPRCRVLVVDDNADAAATLRMLLEVQGHDARAAYTGPAALDLLAEFDAQVVLLDLGMPHMDGFEVARRIRGLPQGRHMVLVALTGWGQADDRQRTADAGFDEHLTKPVDAERLAAILASVGCHEPPRSEPGAPARVVPGA
jgi:PAS domain S-box-containing protein